MADKGISPDLLIEAILALIDEDDYNKASESALKALKMGSISQEEIMRMLAASKALGSGGMKIRGWKQISEILKEADLSTAEGKSIELLKAENLMVQSIKLSLLIWDPRIVSYVVKLKLNNFNRKNVSMRL